MKKPIDLTELKQYATLHDPSLIKRIENFLKNPDVNGMKGSERLQLVCENFKSLSFDQAYHLLDPEAFLDEFEDAQSYKHLIKGLNFARVFFSLAPLIMTWFALFHAATGYQDDLMKYPNDKTTAFLQLWQDGFHHTTALTFSVTAIIDVGLLLGFLVTTIWILALEYQNRNKTRAFAEQLHIITDGLLKAVNEDGITPVTSQADIDKVVKAVRAALGGVFDDLSILINDSRNLILKAESNVEQLFLTLNPLLTTFGQNVLTFQQDIDRLTQDIGQITVASAEMKEASIDMTKASQEMVQINGELSKHVSQVGIYLAKIDTGQQQTVHEMKQVAVNMDRTADEIRGVAVNVDNTASKVKDVSEKIVAMNPQDVQRIAASASDFANKTKIVTTELQNVIALLQKFGGTSPRKRSRIFPWFK